MKTTKVKYVKNNKILVYGCGISVLVLLYYIFSLTFNLITVKNNMSANIAVGDLDYKMVINAVDLNSSKGTKTVLKDRIILAKAGIKEQFDITLVSLNSATTKYEIVYKVCSDAKCTSYKEKPEKLEILYNKNKSSIHGLIHSSSVKEMGIYVVNETKNDYYIQIGLNVEDENKELVLQNQINSYLTSDLMDANINIVAYVNGKLVTAFPTEPDFEASIVCRNHNNELTSARGLFNYTDSGWKLDIFNINTSPLYCRVDFEEMIQVTYDVIALRYNCANKQEIAVAPIIDYEGDCSLHLDDNNNWYMKLLTNGTLSVSGKMWLDVFLVGGGASGDSADYYNGGTGGGGGKNNTSYNVEFLNTTSYQVSIGTGGGATALGGVIGKAGNASSINGSNVSLSAAGGTPGIGGGGGARDGDRTGGNGTNGVRAFGGTTNDSTLYGASGGGGGATSWGGNPWPGGGGAGGTTGGGTGGAGGEAHTYGSEGESATVANVGAGGGGGGAGNQTGGTGGTGVVIIRNAR